VLVEDRLAHAGRLGDVVHRGGVESLRDEDLPRGIEQLGATLTARQTLAAHRRSPVGRHRHAGDPTYG
jgi:hypothetical protein